MSRKIVTPFKILAMALVLIWPATTKADLISENFDELTPSLNATNLGAFTVTSGSVDVVGGGLFGSLCAAPESGNCVDLDGSSYTAGQISTADLTLAPGTYTLTFDLIGSQRTGYSSSTTVTLGSLYNQTFVLSGNDVTSGIVSTTINVGTTNVAPLIFTSNDGASNVGALLDNVSLVFNAAPVPTPEPGTLSLLGIGFTSLMFIRRRVAKQLHSRC